MTIDKDRIGILRAAVQPFHAAFRPVFRCEEGSARRRIEGTAILVEDGPTRFAITAGHVVAGSERKLIGVRDSEAVVWPIGYSTLKPVSDSFPDADVAWSQATVRSGETSLNGAFPAALAVAALEDSDMALYVAAGFPVSRAKVRMGTGLASAKLMFASVDLAPADMWAELNLDRRVHMAFTYSQDGRVDLKGDAVVGAHPRGMSGGAILVLGRAGDTEGLPTMIPFLVGVLTQFHERHGVLVATRVRHLWTSIGYQPPIGEPMYRRVDA